VIAKIQTRLTSEQGFSLIELLVVLNIIGILSAMAVPSYIGFRARAEAAAASANVKTAVPAAEAYYLLPAPGGGNGSYSGLSAAVLRQQTPGIDQSSNFKAGPNGTNDGYCVEDTDGSITYSYTGGIGGTAILTASACTNAYTVA
jgi:prepilin-type N-terminal cleavage/methylation domain-containing protein